MNVWIDAVGTKTHETVNKRQSPSMVANTIGSLTTLGEFVRLIAGIKGENYTWAQYQSFGDDLRFWVRGDVHHMVVLDDEEFILGEPTIRQFMHDAEQHDLKHIHPLHLSDILDYVVIHKKPVTALLYCHHLLPDCHEIRYVYIIGYRIRRHQLYIVVHDTDGQQEYPAEQVVRALAHVGRNTNLAFQGMVIE